MKRLLDQAEERLKEWLPGGVTWDERCLKPLERALAKASTEDDVEALGIALGEILSRQFQLDWVQADFEGGPRLALNLPYTETVFDPDRLFLEKFRDNKAINVRTIHLDSCEWLEEHAFD